MPVLVKREFNIIEVQLNRKSSNNNLKRREKLHAQEKNKMKIE